MHLFIESPNLKSRSMNCHFVAGYPYHGNPTPQPAQNQNDVNIDHYDYDYSYYEYETEAPLGALPKSDVVISPHPFLVSVQRWLNGLESRQFDLGLFSGNTIVSFNKCWKQFLKGGSNSSSCFVHMIPQSGQTKFSKSPLLCNS